MNSFLIAFPSPKATVNKATTTRYARCFGLSAVAVAIISFAGARTAQAQAYLVGAELYSSSASGATINSGYSYSTNTADGITYVLSLTLNGNTFGKGIAILLTPGANNFVINTSPQGPVDPGSFAGINLFFSPTATSYNPVSGARAPDLTYSSSVGAGATGDLTPVAGTLVTSYVTQNTSPANGLAAIIVGGNTLSTANLVTTHSATGSFTINNIGSSSAPEPSALLLLAPGVIGLIAARRRRAA